MDLPTKSDVPKAFVQGYNCAHFEEKVECPYKDTENIEQWNKGVEQAKKDKAAGIDRIWNDGMNH